MVKRYILIFLFACVIGSELNSQWSYMPVINDTYGTGYISGIDSWINNYKNTGDIYVGEANFSTWDYLGWAMFDISSIPQNATINSIQVEFNVENNSSSGGFTLCISRLNIDPRNDNVTAFDIGNSFYQTTNYDCKQIGKDKGVIEVFLYDNRALVDLQNAVNSGNKWWGVFLHEDGFDDKRVIFHGNNSNNSRKPRLAIMYTEQCDPPDNLSVQNITQTSARLEWSDNPNAQDYEIAFRENGSTWNYHTVNSNYYNANGLECGTEYEFRVRTNCGSGNYSIFTEVFEFKTLDCPCNIPAGLTVSNLSQTGATLDWENVEGAAGYEVSIRKVDSAWSYYQVNSSYLEVTGLQCEEDYEFAVRTFCGEGNYSDFTTAYEFTTLTCPCNIPADLGISNLNQTSAVLEWGEVAHAEGYEIGIRIIDGSWNYFTSATNSYNISGLECGSNYEFLVRTNCGSGNYSDYSAVLEFTTLDCPCNIPAGLTVLNLDQTSARLDWADVERAIGYEVSIRKIDSAWSYYQVDSSYLDVSGLQCEEDYEFAVRSFCSADNYSEFTTAYEFTTLTCPCYAPTDLGVSNLNQTSASLDWSEVTDAVGYEIGIRLADSTWSYFTVATNSYNVLGLECGSNYEFIVRTNCGSGNYSDYSDAFGFMTHACHCNIPAGLTVLNLDQTSAYLDWENVDGAIGYELAIRKIGETWSYISVDTSSFEVTDLECGEDYEFTVRTYCGEGNYSSFTTVFDFTTEACPCNTPTGLNIANLDQTTATLDWSDVSGAEGYEVAFRKEGASWSFLTVGSSYYNVLGLVCENNYEFRVRSNCGSGNYSEYSPEFDFTAALCPCEVPVDLSVSNLDQYNARLNWTEVTGAAGYEVAVRRKDSIWIVFEADNNYYDVSDLLCDKDYEFAVRTKCSEINFSQYSEVVDFTTGSCPCYFPTNLSFSNLTANSVILDWSDVPESIGFDVRLKSASASTWTYHSTTNSSFATTYLDCGETYDWQVSTFCGENNYSIWVSDSEFTTDPCSCSSPNGLTVGAITTYSALLEWQNIPGNNGYEVRYKSTFSPTWRYLETNTNSVSPSDLECGISYNWQLRTNCGDGSYSKWVSGTVFTTEDCSCENPTELTAIIVSQTIADLEWSALPEIIGYELRYRPQSSSAWLVTHQITAAEYSITDLECGAVYSWEVRVNCGYGNFGSWISGNDFIMDECPCEVPQIPEFIAGEKYPVIHTYNDYKVQVVPGVTGYIWELSDGVAAEYFNTLTAKWSSLGTKTISVKSVNECAESESEIFSAEVVRPTSTQQNLTNLNLKVFPNPTSGLLYLKPSSVAESDYTISIVDFTGKEIFNQLYKNINDREVIALDLSDLMHGIYLLRISNKEFLHIEKIVVK